MIQDEDTFNVEVFDGTDWVVGSTHTQEVDAKAQVEIYKANGKQAGDIRIKKIKKVREEKKAN